MTSLIRLVFAGSLGLLAAFLVACGQSNGLLPASQGSGLAGQLDSVKQAVDSGDCSHARAEAHKLSAAIQALPPQVDAKLRRSLSDGAAKLLAQAATNCHEVKTDTTPTTTTETQTVPTETTPTAPTTPTTPTQTTPTQTTPTQTTPTTPPAPKPKPTPPSGGGSGGTGGTGGGATSGGAGPGGKKAKGKDKNK